MSLLAHSSQIGVFVYENFASLSGTQNGMARLQQTFAAQRTSSVSLV